MAKQIKKSDISEADVFQNIRQSAEKTILTINKLNQELTKTSTKLKNTSSGQKFDSTESLNKFITNQKQANKLVEQAVKLDKQKSIAEQQKIKATAELERLEQQKQRTQQQKIRTQEAEARQQNRINKEKQRTIKMARDESNAYKRLVKATREQKNESKRLAVELLNLEKAGKKNTTQFRKLSREYRNVTRQAQKGDKALKKIDRTVGDNFRNVGNYRSALGKLSGMLGSLGLAFGGGMIFRNVIGTIKDFDQAQANLSAVLGVTRDGMSGLTEQAKQLGATTRFTAGEVSALQLEFAKLGFTQAQIEGVTDATLSLASATNSDLATSSQIVGANVRAFGLDVSETQRVVDVMAKSFTITSLDMEKFSTAMRSVAPVSANAGVSIERTTAMLGTLTDRGIDSSTAGTGLRNVFLELSKSGMTFEEAMSKINNASDKNAVSLELFGKRGAVVGTILAENGFTIDDFTEKLNKAQGTAQEMADKQLNTLSGSLDLLKSAWDGYILSSSEAGGVAEKLRDGIKTLADNLATILDTVGKVVKIFVIYKTVTLAQVGANRLLQSSMIQTATSVGGLKGAMRGLGMAVKKIGTAFKQNIIGIAVVSIMTLIQMYRELNDLMTRNETLNEDIAKAQEKNTSKTEKQISEMKSLFEALKKTNKGSRERKNLIDEINRRYGTTLKNLDNEKDFVNSVNVSYQNLMTTLKKKTAIEGKRIAFEVSQRSLKEVEMELRQMEQVMQGINAKTTKINMFGFGGVDQAMKTGQAPSVSKASTGEDAVTKLVSGIFGKLFGTTDVNTVVNQYNALGKSYAKMWKTAQKAEKEYNDANAKFIMNKPNKTTPMDVETDGDFTPDEPTTPEKISLQNKIARERIAQMKDGFKKQRALLVQKLKEDKESIKKMNAFKSEQNTLIKEKQKTFDLEMEKIDEAEAKRKREIEKEISEARLEIMEDGFHKERKAENLRHKMERKQFYLDSQKDIYEDEQKNKIFQLMEEKHQKNLQKIKDKYSEEDYKKEDENLQKLTMLKETELLKSGKTQEEIEEELFNYEVQIYERRIALAKKFGFDSSQLENELAKKLFEKQQKDAKKLYDEDKKIKDKQLEKEKQFAEAQQQIIQGLTDFALRKSEERMEKIDEEIKKAKEQADLLRKQAENGTIEAKESLAKQNELIIEANRKKEAELKRMQRIEFANTVYQTYQDKVKDGSENPLVDTIKDVTLLNQFISSLLPTFLEGTEDTGTHGRGIDGKGGFKAILHPNERVLTKEQNAMIGDLTNEELAQIGNDYQTGQLLNEGATQIGKSWETGAIVKKLESLEQTIKNKPVSNVQVEEIVSGALTIARETKHGNKTIYNRYKVK